MAGIAAKELMSWPATLTNKSWQKAKGVIAKAAGETGVGAALDAAENRHGRIDFTQLEPTVRVRSEIPTAVATAKRYYATNIEPLRDDLAKVISKAEAAKKKLAKIPLSKDTIKALDKIIGDAEKFRVSLKSVDLDAILKRLDAELSRKEGTAAPILKPKNIDNAISLVTAFGKKPSIATWPKQPLRAIGAALKQINHEPWAKKHQTVFAGTFKSFDEEALGIKDAPNDDEAKRMKAIAVALIKQLQGLKGDTPF
jgi:hypothetical protein